ncbi:uncharacterized protein LOC112680568 isoform X2 [Sipha flava]|uniref:Uncharacterized protein LOC112680568 isoform X2 n=1 Tax=Sipha flava TaxID=143950 RepID=A0A8B8F6P3_9HEMI|nr:uncharacterized protein LOC112680568 isoform X2 [Sipha flava]
MSKNTFKKLLSGIKNNIRKQDTVMRKSIPPNEKLALTLRYLGSGYTMSDLHIDYRIRLSTISNIVREVCESLWATFKKSCFPTITEELLAKVATEFEERANFPHVIGAIDGKHIQEHQENQVIQQLLKTQRYINC